MWKCIIACIVSALLGVIVTILVMLTDPGSEREVVGDWGKNGMFIGKPQLELDNNGRDSRLLQDFVYVDKNGRSWVAPKNHVVNGASIPRPFWSITGAPMTGKFRNASVVHDAECDKRTSDWKEVHRVFYEACLCGGVEEKKAKLLYAAVYHFGPSWETKLVSEMMTKTVDGKEMEMIVFRDLPVWIRDVSGEIEESNIELLENAVEEGATLDELEMLPVTKRPIIQMNNFDSGDLPLPVESPPAPIPVETPQPEAAPPSE